MERRKAAEHENHERWLVSYADFITLLFAFFVVMFASSQADKGKAKEVSDSVRDALEHGPVSGALAVMLGRGKFENSKPPQNPDRVKRSENLPPAAGQPGDLQKSLETLQHGLDGEMKSGKIQMWLEQRGLVISLRETAFFASGDDAVDTTSFPILDKIIAVIRPLPNSLRLEGHTDSMPIHNSRFHSNWELSAARSIAVLELLRVRFQIPPERMSVAGYAENAPADTNETEEGRGHNRRVDVVVLTSEALKAEPKPAAPQPGSGPSAPRSP